MISEIQEKLTKLAFKRSIPFCLSCYHEAPSGRCETCASDDLARLIPGCGVDWNTDWIVKHILETELTEVNTEEAFENYVRDCFPETTTIGWLTVDTATALKECDPVAWELSKSEWADSELDEGRFFSPDNGATLYEMSDVEELAEGEG